MFINYEILIDKILITIIISNRHNIIVTISSKPIYGGLILCTQVK